MDAILARVTARTRMVFLANPNNPTGTYIPFSEVKRLHQGLPPHVLLVLDAAYAEFVRNNDYEAGIALVAEAEKRGDDAHLFEDSRPCGICAWLGLLSGGGADVLNRIVAPSIVSSPAQARVPPPSPITALLRRRCHTMTDGWPGSMRKSASSASP